MLHRSRHALHPPTPYPLPRHPPLACNHRLNRECPSLLHAAPPLPLTFPLAPLPSPTTAHRHDHSSRAHTVVRVRVESAKISGRAGGATPRAAIGAGDAYDEMPSCELSPSYLDPEPGGVEPPSPAASLPAHFAAATTFSDPSTPPRVDHAGLEP